MKNDRKEGIATEADVLRKLTQVMESNDSDGKNLSSICRAAELLGKFYGLFDGSGWMSESKNDKAIIIDDTGN